MGEEQAGADLVGERPKVLVDQAGMMSRKTPGTARSPYQPTPKPSALTPVLASWARRLCSIRE